MAETTAQRLTAVEEAIAKVRDGVQSITSPDGRTTTYPPLRELLAERRSILDEIARANGNDRRVCEF